ncbi:MAG TPA: lipid II flippase Amj family protein [Bacteroidales bacterium]|nr:lipid II flippase Amj family protein [Bacteroidales bacterium]
MSIQIILVIVLTFLINLITTLSYSVRIVGIRTGRIAISFALFNILVLISRTANGFQAPLLAKSIESNIKTGLESNLWDFRLIIFSCTIATIIGGLLIPTFQRVLSVAVTKFSIYKSVPRVIFYGFTKGGIAYLKESLVVPNTKNITQIDFKDNFPWKVFIMNVVAVAIITVGVISSLYAGYLNPDLRTTSSALSSVINGFATILMFVFIDPFLSVMTDEVVLGNCKESLFRRYIVYMVFARIVGTLVAQVIFVPSAKIIAYLSGIL